MTALADSDTLFSDVPPRRRTLLGPRWWIGALVLHTALLALPVSWWMNETRPIPERIVEVTLDVVPVRPTEPEAPAPPQPEPEPIEIPPPQPVPDPRPAEPAVPAQPDQVSPMDSLAEESATPEPGEPAEPATLEVERLLETVASMDWSAPEAARAPSRSTESALVDALREPVIPMWSNRFDGMPAPAETEITDRWLGPDGTHQVVIRAPDGNTYCGRQAPVDDLRPWLQMPMLFHRCAGGGKRSPSATWRNN